jgi:hypothetical protein
LPAKNQTKPWLRWAPPVPGRPGCRACVPASVPLGSVRIRRISSRGSNKLPSAPELSHRVADAGHAGAGRCARSRACPASNNESRLLEMVLHEHVLDCNQATHQHGYTWKQNGYRAITHSLEGQIAWISCSGSESESGSSQDGCIQQEHSQELTTALVR